MNNTKGFALVMVVMILAMIGIFMGFLTQTSQLLIYQTNQTHMQVVQRNMTLSALAWAHENQTTHKDTSIDLDTSELGMKKSYLCVHTSIDQDMQTLVTIESSCSKGRRTIKQEKVFHLPHR